MANQSFESKLHKPIDPVHLAGFRVLIGLLLLYSTLRFWSKGWIEELYIHPRFFFKYPGFAWVEPLPGDWMYLPFALMVLGALGIVMGLFHRWAALVYCLSFTYVELIDVSNYLNHYYFISLLTFAMAWLPLDGALSVRKPKSLALARYWHLAFLRFFIGLVYVYAGLAKLNSDWLLEAQPLKIWLAAHSDWPLVGWLLAQHATAYAFAWAGMFFDCTVPFWLSHHMTRPYAYAVVVFFHFMTWLLFPIGVFPWVMMAAATVFFPVTFYRALFRPLLKRRSIAYSPPNADPSMGSKPWASYLAGVFLLVQLVLPWRYLLNERPLFWYEDGYRFSWRVMLMEKAGVVFFYVQEGQSGERKAVEVQDWLSLWQYKQLCTQPDLILQMAHEVGRWAKRSGMEDPRVFAEGYVTLNGRPSQPYTDPKVNLLQVPLGAAPECFILRP